MSVNGNYPRDSTSSKPDWQLTHVCVEDGVVSAAWQRDPVHQHPSCEAHKPHAIECQPTEEQLRGAELVEVVEVKDLRPRGRYDGRLVAHRVQDERRQEMDTQRPTSMFILTFFLTVD